MHRSAIALALGLSATLATYPVLAAKDTLLSFSYVAQENCISAPGFTPDFDPINYAGIGWSDFHGTVVFDLSNRKASWTSEGTFQILPFGSNTGQGQPSTQYPASFWITPSPCVFDFNLYADLSFVLLSRPAGCSFVTSIGPNAGHGGTVFDVNFVGQFAPDMKSYIAGHAGYNQQQQPIVQTQRFENGFEQKRICTSILHAVKVEHGKE